MRLSLIANRPYDYWMARREIAIKNNMHSKGKSLLLVVGIDITDDEFPYMINEYIIAGVMQWKDIVNDK